MHQALTVCVCVCVFYVTQATFVIDLLLRILQVQDGEGFSDQELEWGRKQDQKAALPANPVCNEIQSSSDLELCIQERLCVWFSFLNFHLSPTFSYFLLSAFIIALC